MFDDRKDAGRKLARALEKYKDKDVLVLAIPKGGVEVGYEVSKYLNAEFSIIISRKLPFLDNPESGFGAVSEDGSIFLFDFAKEIYSQDVIEEIIEKQKKEIKRRIAVLRENKPLPEIKGRTVILVDDGIAMGSTMRSSIELCRKQKAKKVVVAVPVSSRDNEREFKTLADEAIVLEKPSFFQAVAQVYRNWYDVPDEEVTRILLDMKKIDS